MTRRWLIRFLLVAIFAGFGLAVTAAPARADICTDAPAPISPKAGLPGLLTVPPNNIPDVAPDPFTDTKVTIAEVYGNTWRWSNYDLGCGEEYIRDPAAYTTTASANSILSLDGAMIAWTDSLEWIAKSSSIDWLTDIVVKSARLLDDPIFQIGFPILLLGLAVILAVKAHRAQNSEMATRIGVIFISVVIATFGLMSPDIASKGMDKVVVQVSTQTGSVFNQSAADAITRQSAYRTWLAGNFGDPDSQLAKELGPRLMSATHYTWSDMKRIQADPDARKAIDKQKADEFEAVAKEIEQKDPSAYETFTGRSVDRMGVALLGVVTVIFMGLFIVMAMFTIILARVLVQGIAIAAPIIAMVGLIPAYSNRLRQLWDFFTAAVLAVFKFTLASGLMTIILGAIQNSDLNPVAKLVAFLVVTIVAIKFTSPIKSLKTLVPGVDPNRKYLAGVGKSILQGVVAGATGGATAAVIAPQVIANATQPQQTPQPGQPYTQPAPTYATAQPAMAALPSPTYVQPAPTTHTVNVTVPDSTTTTGWAGVAPTAQPEALTAAPLALEGAPVTLQQTRQQFAAHEKANEGQPDPWRGPYVAQASGIVHAPEPIYMPSQQKAEDIVDAEIVEDSDSDGAVYHSSRS